MLIDSIQNGIVIDHITAGKAMELYQILGLDKLACTVAILKNVTSGKLGRKDIIKIDGEMELDWDLIGYVGATGLATGPHLDFRIWRGSTPIDPLKVPSEPAEPIRQGNRTAFNVVKERIMAELSGDVADSLKVTSLELDSLCKAIPNTAAPVAPDKGTPAKPAAPAAKK